MTYNIERPEGSAKIAFEVTAAEWDGYIERVYQKERGKINIAGFRKGHAPRHLIERMYGKGVFVDDALNLCFKELYAKALDENKDLYPVEEPRAEIESLDDKGLKFSVSFAVKPEPVLGQYKGLKIGKVEYNVTDKDVDAEVEKARKRLERKIEKPENIAASNGDTVNIDYNGSVGGKKFEGGTAQKQELNLGSGSFIPGFEAQVVGMKKGDTRDINVKFPEDYHAEELKGKDAVFSVTVNNVYTVELPAVDDELAKEVSSFTTLTEYKADIKKRLNEEAASKAKTENENALVDKIVDNCTADIPEGMIESELDYMLTDFSYQLMYMYGGMKLDDYFKYSGTTKEDYRMAHREQAKRNVKTRLTLERIIKDEKLEITDEELSKGIDEAAEKAKKTKEEYLKDGDEGRISYVKNSLLSKKLIDFLVSQNSFVKKTGKKTEAKA